MQAITVQELLSSTRGTPVRCADQIDAISRIVIDSRQVQKGDLFWPVIGNTCDGHNYIADALNRGAAGFICNSNQIPANGNGIAVEDTLTAFWDFAEWYRERFDPLVIGITGSVGKTTTRRMIAAVLSQRFRGVQSPKNYNNELGVPLSLLQIDATTEFAVIEMGASRTGEIADLASIAHPEVAILTAIAPAHLEHFGTLSDIIEAKSELLSAIPTTGFAILNGDDKNLVKLADHAPCRTILVGEKDHNDIVCDNVSVDREFLELHVNQIAYRAPVCGRHHVTAILISIAIAQEIGLTSNEIQQGLLTYTPEPGRCQVRRIGDYTIIDDTYNSSPNALSAACRTLMDWPTHGKRILIVGDMLELGEWSDSFHELAGREIARSNITHLITVGPQAALTARTALECGMDAGCLGICSDHQLATALLELWLQPHDVALVKGSRGMRMEQVIEHFKTRDSRATGIDIKAA